MKINIALLDDEKEFHEFFKKELNEQLKESTLETYQNPNHFLEAIKSGKKKYDVIFMDIDMPEINGIQIAKELFAEEIEGIIIFLTNKKDLVYEAFGLNVYRFIGKDELTKKKQRLFQDLEKDIFNNSDLLIQNDYNTYRIKRKEILYAEKVDRDVIVVTKHQRFVLKSYKIGTFYQELGGRNFQFANRSTIVNLKYVKRLKRDSVELMYCTQTIDLSRGRTKPFVEEYNRFMSE